MDRVRRVFITTVALAALIAPASGPGTAHAARKSCVAKGPNGSCSVFVPGAGGVTVNIVGVTSRGGGNVYADGDALAGFGGPLQNRAFSLPPGFCSCVVTVVIDPPAGVVALSAQY